MPRMKEANQRIREAQRAKILEAAWKVFARHGLTATMAEVAAEAGVSYGLAYRYFVNKEALFHALVEQSFHAGDASFQRFAALPGTPGERLDRLVVGLVETRRDHPEFAQVHDQVLSDAATPPDLRERALRYGQAFHDLLRRLIIEGQAEGSVRAADPDQLVTVILAALDGLTRAGAHRPGALPEAFSRCQHSPGDAQATCGTKGERAMNRKGVNYDVGTEMGSKWRPDYNPQTVRRELEIIKNDLHCTAVGISGKDIGRVIVTAEAALSLGLEAWLNPADWNNKPAEPTLAYITKAAKAAQPLHERYPGKVVFSIGSEFTLFMQGILPGKTLLQRARNAFQTDFVKTGQHNQPLNDFLGRANEAVRNVFSGPVLYRSLSFEQVDWSNFDFIGIDHYWGEVIKDRYIDMVKPLFAYGKPVINTGFGFNTTNAPVVGMLSTLGNSPYLAQYLHQLPVIGRIVRPKLKVINERDEATQARRLIDNLKLLDRAGFNGAFIDTFIFPINPYSDIPKYDLGRANSSLVKYYEGGTHGTTYPDMTWEPKESFRAVADYYATH